MNEEKKGLEEIKTYLSEADQEKVKLYLIEKRKHKKTEIEYKVLKTTITPEIGKVIVNTALQQVESILACNPEYMDYGTALGSDRRCVETIDKSEVPHLLELMQQVSNPELEVFMDGENSKISGYVVKIESKNKTLFLFRKYSPKKLLEKGKISMIFNQGRFEKLNKEIMALDTIYDAALLLTENERASQIKVFIFNRPKFESLFSFADGYEKEIENNKETITEKEFLDDIDLFLEYAKEDSRAIKKLARIIKNGEFERMTKEKIKKIVREYNLTLEFDADGKIKVTKENMWTILRILDDDYVHSEATDTKYEARAKVKK